MAKKIAVKIENKTFNSLKEACKYLKIKNVAGIAHAIKSGNTKYKGLNIEVLPNKPQVKRTTKACPVVCETLGKTFKTIRQAANFAKVDGWTMSKKMETAGQFKDKEGNIYKRLRAMRSKNVYANTGDTLKTTRAFAHRTINKPIVEVTSVVQESPVNKSDMAKSILKSKVIESIKNNNYTLAKNLIDVIEEL